MNKALGMLPLFTILFPIQTSAQDASAPLVGTWKYITQSITEVQSGKVTKPFGEKPSGYITYTRGGRLQTILVGDGRQKPELPLKDEDRVKLFNTFLAATGTYKVEGNTLTISYDTSWNELWTGTTQTRSFEITGNSLTVKSAPSKNAAGNEVFFTVVLEKVE